MPTLLGLLSDAHGNAPATRRAAEQLLALGATTLVYLGDACADRVLDELAGLRTPAGEPVAVHLVPGNCDGMPGPLLRYAKDLGLDAGEAPRELSLGGKRIVFAHGHESGVFAEARKRKADIFLHGHTHMRESVFDLHLGKRMQVVCPGSVSSPRDGLPPSAALLEVESGKVVFVEVR